jgi:hypothetical protein
MRNHSAVVRLYPVSLFFILTSTLTAQSLVLKLDNLPPSGGRLRILCELNTTLVRQSQFDYAAGTAVINKVIQLPAASGYQLRATVSTGLGKFPLIIASGKIENVEIVAGSQSADIVLGTPKGELVRGGPVQGGMTVFFRYADAGLALRAGDVTTLWCSDKSLKINTSGRQIIAPSTVGPDGRLVAKFLVPDSDTPMYCQGGFYSKEPAPNDQIPVFVYPDLAAGAAPLTVSAFLPSIRSSSAPAQSSAGPAAPAGPARPGARTVSTITVGKDGRLERKNTSDQ